MERDKAGWTPLCYAAVSGNPLLLVALLQQRANPNDSIRHASQQQVGVAASYAFLRGFQPVYFRLALPFYVMKPVGYSGDASSYSYNWCLTVHWDHYQVRIKVTFIFAMSLLPLKSDLVLLPWATMGVMMMATIRSIILDTILTHSTNF